MPQTAHLIAQLSQALQAFAAAVDNTRRAIAQERSNGQEAHQAYKAAAALRDAVAESRSVTFCDHGLRMADLHAVNRFVCLFSDPQEGYLPKGLPREKQQQIAETRQWALALLGRSTLPELVRAYNEAQPTMRKSTKTRRRKARRRSLQQA